MDASSYRNSLEKQRKVLSLIICGFAFSLSSSLLMILSSFAENGMIRPYPSGNNFSYMGGLEISILFFPSELDILNHEFKKCQKDVPSSIIWFMEHPVKIPSVN
ncbi:hypothetical protein ACH5RR_033379 [Cinchona calisaya]|uniref:Uncharacterized protein n=1 Tax=Cinchona calisaya TaxID=153742 RepID=A0ABD2YNX5_9GENT